MRAMWRVVGVLIVIILVAAYLIWTAARVKRLHQRAAAAYAALDAQLVRRAVAAATLADTAPWLGERAEQLRATAQAALDADQAERELAENDLTKLLRDLDMSGWETTKPVMEVVNTSRRVALARQVHTDLVRDALALRRRPLVRMLRLARRHPPPAYFDIGDTVLPMDLTPVDIPR